MDDIDRAKAALKAGNTEHAIALSLIRIAEYLTMPPLILNYHQEPL